MTEAQLVKKQIDKIRQRGGWAKKSHGGPQTAGWPDIVATYKGYFVGIETKLPGKENTLTKLQAETLESIKRAGGVARMYTTVGQVEALLDALDRRKVRRKYMP